MNCNLPQGHLTASKLKLVCDSYFAVSQQKARCHCNMIGVSTAFEGFLYMGELFRGLSRQEHVKCGLCCDSSRCKMFLTERTLPCSILDGKLLHIFAKFANINTDTCRIVHGQCRIMLWAICLRRLMRHLLCIILCMHSPFRIMC